MSAPLVKICGMTRLEDAQRAAGLGAFAVGFVFWPRSPRAISPEQAALIAPLPAHVLRVGVFVDQSPDDVAAIVREARLDVIQLHGHEDVRAYTSVGARIFKAVHLETEADVSVAASLPDAVTILIDAADRDLRGGTGKAANWRLAAMLSQRRPVMLAGGLRADNAAAAIGAVRPWAVDVSSGVEISPGIKSSERLAQFFAAVAASSPSTSRDRLTEEA